MRDRQRTRQALTESERPARRWRRFCRRPGDELAGCVSYSCDPTDVTCIVDKCADAVGGAANLATVGALARAAPFAACAADCFPAPRDGDRDDGGDDAGQ
jgi:hypothetical protein